MRQDSRGETEWDRRTLRISRLPTAAKSHLDKGAALYIDFKMALQTQLLPGNTLIDLEQMYSCRK